MSHASSSGRRARGCAKEYAGARVVNKVGTNRSICTTVHKVSIMGKGAETHTTGASGTNVFALTTRLRCWVTRRPVKKA